jgi:electron transport complex protein RnfC
MFFFKNSRETGTHPNENKNTRGMTFVELNDFKTLTIPLDLQVGPGCDPLIKKGDYVKVGQKIGEPKGAWSVPSHSSVSGTVISVKKEILSNGSYAELIVIESDGKYEVDESVVPPVVTDRKSFLEAVRNAGLVGLGGAAFPTHIKLDPPPGKTLDTLILNGAECEPYNTCDDQLMRDRADDVVLGALLVCRYLELPRCLIGVEDNKPEAVAALKAAIAKNDLGSVTFEVHSLPTLYPTGAEKVMIRLLTDRIVKEGGLPADVGTVVLNVGTAAYIKRFLDTGMPLVRKFVTVDGGIVKKPGNYDIPIGATVKDVLEQAGGGTVPPSKVIMGGPMMGIAIDDPGQPVLKHTNCLLYFDEKEATIPRESACINCGRCVRKCPLQLMPTDLDSAARREDIDLLIEGHVMNCIECGCCTYVCPAKRYLVQNIRIGKQLFRKYQAKKKEAR